MNVKKTSVKLFFTLFIWQYKKILRIFTKNFLKGMQSKFPQKSTIYTLFRDGERARVIGLCLSALLRLSVKMTPYNGV